VSRRRLAHDLGGDTKVAPAFTLRVTSDQNLSLSDLAGRLVVLAFYLADWRPLCGDQMAALPYWS